ncbi:MAG: AAA family ATPase [Candidatus Aenigmarchaeota archaeon]|nr:AAA family ATPase [Candidatus Aenigmarchaeota archaeon]
MNSLDSRKSTGIIGLDEKMEGGFVEGSVVLLRGKAGTGKTSFCASFLYKGALSGEPGLYVTTEENEEDIKNDIKKVFGWDLDELERRKLLKFLSIKMEIPYNTKKENLGEAINMYMLNIFEKIFNAVKSIGAKRVVIDSISIIEMFLQNRYLSRAYLMELTRVLKSAKATTIITEGVSEAGGLLGDEALAEFVADAVIKLDFVPASERFKRTLTITKMRRTNHSTYILPFDFTKKGLKLMEFEE